jgi:hypothetical protein
MCRKTWLTAKTAKFNILTAPFDFLLKSPSPHTQEREVQGMKLTKRKEAKMAIFSQIPQKLFLKS